MVYGTLNRPSFYLEGLRYFKVTKLIFDLIFELKYKYCKIA